MTFRTAILLDEKMISPPNSHFSISLNLADDFLSWVESLRREKDVLRLSYTTYVKHRSAFSYLCEIYNWEVSPLSASSIAKYFSGLNRTLVSKHGNGIEKPTSRKASISFRL
ncbi:Hypothetical protein PHPALM_16903 [Phytophthora palmivora]|uniref:Uncharacterized protein n=1 Tax=Phytophthora palmivora TaxID=4796 RepID=A0A2P4XNM7_9STRA|nr:Hypothetical protein PHPALM_16903 [Phytophthora palmivora]